MIPVLSRAQMRAFDARAIEVAHVPSIVLMENAGRGAAERILAIAGKRRVVIVCGSGNNGGDGFVVARHLLLRGGDPSVFMCGKPEKLTQDARINRDAWVGVGGTVDLLQKGPDLELLRIELDGAAVVVDAMFGTGLDRAISGLAAEVIELLNTVHVKRVALDIPSGLDCDTGVPLGPTFQADLTLTFAQPKLGLLTPRGVRHTGELEVIHIGVPSEVPADVGYSAQLLERADVARWLAPRTSDAHKYSAGHVAVLAGSPGKLGAALLVAHGTLRAGAGAATIVTWPEAVAALQSRVLEVMTASIDRDAVAASIDAALRSKRAVVIGPGFGLDEPARAALAHVLASWRGPLVLDADAITLLSHGDPRLAGVDFQRGSFPLAGPHILTPHAGELARLLETTSDKIESDRFGSATEAARRTGAVVLLKGAHSIIAAPDGRLVINVRGTPALATAGSGDVLAGIIGALSSVLEPFEAACAGAFLHAEGGVASAAGADRGLLASQIADGVPAVLRELF
ncbi:NAD(P)H-hydrate dehydratase [Pendulispora brunnea]|uniref:Bifunctional NAD(P)H-hydrate repair enzyme n=1 Tax=Pendulispora brunnea TaxID=2905690 RepID=A0ABZ2JZW8_9BACT